MNDEQVGQNLGKPLRKVRHSDLKRSSEMSEYRSKCPACDDGVLLLRRHSRTGKLEKTDRCVGCGQEFIYLDIDILNKREKRV